MLPTFGDWDRVLEHLGDAADYLSVHRYVGNYTGDIATTSPSASLDRQIEALDAVCRALQAQARTAKRVCLCFDEWNVWYRTSNGRRLAGRPAPLEEVYNLEDALVVAGFLTASCAMPTW